jgi:hypothetical protein
MDSTTRANRAAWEAASVKHVREYDDPLARAASGSPLTGTERDLLGPVLRSSPEVAHLQSGHGLDDVALVQAGARLVVGIDYSHAAAGAAQRRADELGVACRYIVAAVPDVPLAAVASAGLQIMHVGEHPEPFWRMGGVSAAAWNGCLPNTFSLLAKRRRLACYLSCLPAGFGVLDSVRLTVFPTSHRVAGRRFFDPAGRPGLGREGFGALAGTGRSWRMLR